MSVEDLLIVAVSALASVVVWLAKALYDHLSKDSDDRDDLWGRIIDINRAYDRRRHQDLQSDQYTGKERRKRG